MINRFDTYINRTDGPRPGDGAVRFNEAKVGGKSAAGYMYLPRKRKQEVRALLRDSYDRVGNIFRFGRIDYGVDDNMEITGNLHVFYKMCIYALAVMTHKLAAATPQQVREIAGNITSLMRFNDYGYRYTDQAREDMQTIFRNFVEFVPDLVANVNQVYRHRVYMELGMVEQAKALIRRAINDRNHHYGYITRYLDDMINSENPEIYNDLIRDTCDITIRQMSFQALVGALLRCNNHEKALEIFNWYPDQRLTNGQKENLIVYAPESPLKNVILQGVVFTPTKVMRFFWRNRTPAEFVNRLVTAIEAKRPNQREAEWIRVVKSSMFNREKENLVSRLHGEGHMTPELATTLLKYGCEKDKAYVNLDKTFYEDLLRYGADPVQALANLDAKYGADQIMEVTNRYMYSRAGNVCRSSGISGPRRRRIREVRQLLLRARDQGVNESYGGRLEAGDRVIVGDRVGTLVTWSQSHPNEWAYVYFDDGKGDEPPDNYSQYIVDAFRRFAAENSIDYDSILMERKRHTSVKPVPILTPSMMYGRRSKKKQDDDVSEKISRFDKLLLGAAIVLFISKQFNIPERVARWKVLNGIRNAEQVKEDVYDINTAITNVKNKVRKDDRIVNTDELMKRLDNVVFVDHVMDQTETADASYFYDEDIDRDFVMLNFSLMKYTNSLPYVQQKTIEHELYHLVHQHADYTQLNATIDDIVYRELSLEDITYNIIRMTVGTDRDTTLMYLKMKVTPETDSLSARRHEKITDTWNFVMTEYTIPISKNMEYLTSASELYTRLNGLKTNLYENGALNSPNDKLTKDTLEYILSGKYYESLTQEKREEFLWHDFFRILPLLKPNAFEKINQFAELHTRRKEEGGIA